MAAPEPWELPFWKFLDRPEATSVPRGSILGADVRHVTPEWLEARETGDLRRLAIVLGCPHSLGREELISRILAYSSLRRILARETQGTLKHASGRTLARWLKSVGAFVPPGKYAMAGALIGWRDGCRLKGRKALAEHNHRLWIVRALRRGLDVPAEVLEHYPDLRARPGEYPLFEEIDA
jgi:hypothetical protein